MIAFKDLCPDCERLVGGGPALMPHAELGPNPLEPDDRNSFGCRVCHCAWGVSMDFGWRRKSCPASSPN